MDRKVTPASIGVSARIARWLAVVFVAATVSGTGAVAAAEEPVERADEPRTLEDCEDCFRLDVIIIEGLLRTDRSVVEREFLFEEGDVATVAEVEESLQRLRNTGIFRRVDYELSSETIGTWDEDEETVERDDDRGRLLRVTVDERYTVSPSFRLSRGGDTLQLTLGVQDTNIAGSFLQGGVTYRRLGSANSISLWFREPRFLDGRQRLTFRGGINNRLYTLYDREGRIEGGYLRYERGMSLSFSRDWRRWLRSGFGLSFSDNRFAYDMVGEQRRRAQQQRGGLYDSDQSIGISLSGRLGRVNTFGYRRRGVSLNLEASQRFHFGGVEPRTRRLLARLHQFVELPLDATLAMRAEIGFRTASPSYLQFFAGGLDTVRGTYNNRHRGPHHWLGNVELRVPTFQNDWVIVENTAFFDAVRVADELPRIAGLTAATTGVGLRLISRDFYGLVLRLDYAPPVLDAHGPGLSFGAGQFF